jgi:uroporphyrinogen-III synthase
MTPATARPVIVTRPLAQAEPLARRIEAIGRAAVVFPLLDIQPLLDQAPLRAALSDLHDVAMVAFVSPNAIHAAFAIRKDWPRSLPIAVMGEGSRAALAEHGLTSANATIVSPTDAERTDSQTLLAELDLDTLRGRQVLIVRGETGRELLADELRACGVEVKPVAAYRRAAPVLDDARRAQLLQLLDAQGDWIITSSEALRILVDMVEQAGGPAGVVKMQQQHLVVPHVRIAETARELGFRAMTQTASGDEALLAALQSRP